MCAVGLLFCGCLFHVLCVDFVLIEVEKMSRSTLWFPMLLIGAGGVQCGLSRGEVCLGPAAEEMGRSASVMQHLSCGLLSRCAGLSRGIENVSVVFVGQCAAQSHLVVLVLCCLHAALQGHSALLSTSNNWDISEKFCLAHSFRSWTSRTTSHQNTLTSHIKLFLLCDPRPLVVLLRVDLSSHNEAKHRRRTRMSCLECRSTHRERVNSTKMRLLR